MQSSIQTNKNSATILRNLPAKKRLSFSRIFLASIFIFISIQTWSQTTIWTNPIMGTDPGQTSPYITGQTVAANLTVSGIVRGPGLNGNAGDDRYNANSWTIVNNIGTALTNGDYFSFTLTPAAGYKLNLNSFVYNGARSGTGPQTFAFRGSPDTYSSNIGNATAAGTTISLTDAAYQNLSSIVFGFVGANAGGLTGTYSINDFTFNGSLLGTSATSLSGFNTCVNTPSTAQTFTVNGTGLIPATGTITVAPSANYEVSITSATTGFLGNASATFAASGGNVSKQVWVRLKANSTAGTYSGETINVSGGGFPVADAINVSVSGTINANSTIALTSAAATTSQTVCNNTAITAITYSIGGGGTGAFVTGLPAGITGAYNSGTKVFTISGTPTATGTFNYTVTTTGPCTNPSSGGTITVNPTSTISLSSAAGTNAQMLCINTAITNITYAIGNATGASVTGLPTGVTGSFDGINTFTITGTPSVSGTFSYTVTATGPCPASLNGTITINANSTIALTSAAGTTAQSVCINTAITAITYSIGGGGTGASVTGLPAGITGSYNSGTKVFSISGTPTASGSFNYTVTTAGPCNNPSLSGTITVTPNSTLTLTSAAGTTSQTVCINNAITNITYLVGGSGTGASITAGALPAGVTGLYNSGTKVFTISGTPTASGTFSYTVTTTGPCSNPSLSGTITVNANSSIVRSSASGTDAQTVCINTAITAIKYTVSGGGTGASITAGALPSGVTGSYDAASKVFTISGTPTVSGAFSYTVGTAGPCTNASLSGIITVNPDATITLSSAAGTNAQTLCQSSTPITNITYTIGGSGTGASVTGLPTGVTGSYNATTKVYTISGTPTASGSFTYTVTTTGPCAKPTATGTIIVNAVPTGISITPATSTVCQGSSVTLTGSGTTNTQSTIFNDDFTASSSVSFASAGTVTGSRSQIWSLESSGIQVNATVGTFTSPNGGGIMVAAAAATAANATSSANTTLTSSTVNTYGYTSLILSYVYSYKQGNTGSPSGTVEVSNNGSTWTALATYTATVGAQNLSASGELTLPSTYLNISTLQIRFNFISSNANSIIVDRSSWWALDDVKLNGVPVPLYSWTANTPNGVNGLPSGAETPSVVNKTISVTPTATTVYTLTVKDAVSSCMKTSATTATVNVNPTSIGGTITSNQTICNGTVPDELDLSGNVGNVVMWQSDDNADFTSPTDIENSTNTLTGAEIGPLTDTTYFRAIVQSGNCAAVYSSTTVITVTPDVWLGVNESWGNDGNWTCGVPTVGTDIVIPLVGSGIYPLVDGIYDVRNVVIKNGASLTIDSATAGVLTITGAYSNAGVLANNGRVVLNGTATQTFPGGSAANLSMSTLEINNTSGVTLDKSITIRGAILPTAGTLALGNNYITLRSDSTSNTDGTPEFRSARIGVDGSATPFTYVNGRFVIERYFHAKRAWRLITAPVTKASSSTIFNGWQLGGATTATGAPLGSGVLITGNYTATNGFDKAPNKNPSLKIFEPTTGALNSVVNTKPMLLSPGTYSTTTDKAENIGYFNFVRGDRDPTLLNLTYTHNTTLRDTGKVQTGTQTFTFPLASNTDPKFVLLPNPYASPVDFQSIYNTNQSNIEQRFYAWDPELGDANSVGGYVTYDLLSGATPNNPPGHQTQYIQSTQAVYLQTSNATTVAVTVNESDKTGDTINAPLFRPLVFANSQLAVNLKFLNTGNSPLLADGILAQFSSAYSDAIDNNDAIKFLNPTESFAFSRDGKLLSIERRNQVTREDTLYFNFTKGTKRSYELEFIPEGLESTEAFLVDSYLKTSTPVSMGQTSAVSFSITEDAGSAAADRFMIVFRPSATLPVTFTKVKAYQQGSNINVEWNIENEVNIKQYEVERSTDGRTFSKSITLTATKNNGTTATYSWPDASPVNGANYYRIKSISKTGEVQYSLIVKVTTGNGRPVIAVYPNPATGGRINLQLINQPAGRYNIRLLDKLGQVILSRQTEHAEGSSTESLEVSKAMAHGNYQLEITKPDNNKTVINVLY